MPFFPEDLSQMGYFDMLRKGGTITDDEFNLLKDVQEKIESGIISDNYHYNNRLKSLSQLFISYQRYSINVNEFETSKEELLFDSGSDRGINEYLRKEKLYIAPDGYKKLDDKEIKKIDIGDQIHLFWYDCASRKEEEAYVIVIYKNSDTIIFNNDFQLRFSEYKDSGRNIIRIKNINDINWYENGYIFRKLEKFIK